MLRKCLVQTLTIHPLKHVVGHYRCIVQSLEQAIRKTEHFVYTQDGGTPEFGQVVCSAVSN